MKPVREVVSRDVIEDLWGAGYTILPRNRHPDPFYVEPGLTPQTRAYQWMHLIHDKALFLGSDGTYCLGWSPVPASRHDGYFMPAGFVGDIEVSGLGLFEKPKFEVDAEREKQTVAAHKQVDDWKAKYGGEFSGEVSVGGDRTVIGATKSIEDITPIPKDMVPYIDKIFAERDRLANLHVEAMKTGNKDDFSQKLADWMNDHPSDPPWPALHKILLPEAIQNVRKQITEEANHGN